MPEQIEVKNKTLLAITQEINGIEQDIIAAGGELTPAMESEFNEVQDLLTKKVDAYDFRIRGLNARAELFKMRADEFSRIAKSMTNYADRMKDTIKAAMIERGTTEVSGETVKFKLSAAKPRTVIDEKELPHNFKMILTIADKEKISEAIKNEIEVPGVRMEQTWQLRTYPVGAK